MIFKGLFHPKEFYDSMDLQIYIMLSEAEGTLTEEIRLSDQDLFILYLEAITNIKMRSIMIVLQNDCQCWFSAAPVSFSPFHLHRLISQPFLNIQQTENQRPVH